MEINNDLSDDQDKNYDPIMKVKLHLNTYRKALCVMIDLPPGLRSLTNKLGYIPYYCLQSNDFLFLLWLVLGLTVPLKTFN